MRIRVITPPDPIVTPAEIAGVHADDDESVAAMIAAVTEEIDGPTGWLGRSLGAQTLLALDSCWRGTYRLPFPPVIDVESISYIDAAGVEQTVDDSLYGVESGQVWFREGFSRPALGHQPDPVRITYRAGYDGEDYPAGTGAVPQRARQAIILIVKDMKAMGETDMFVRSVEIPNVETRQYALTEQGSALVRRTADNLLSTLRIFA